MCPPNHAPRFYPSWELAASANRVLDGAVKYASGTPDTAASGVRGGAGSGCRAAGRACGEQGGSITNCTTRSLTLTTVPPRASATPSTAWCGWDSDACQPGSSGLTATAMSSEVVETRGDAYGGPVVERIVRQTSSRCRPLTNGLRRRLSSNPTPAAKVVPRTARPIAAGRPGAIGDQPRFAGDDGRAGLDDAHELRHRYPPQVRPVITPEAFTPEAHDGVGRQEPDGRPTWRTGDQD